jgi:hypothetical protein
MAGPNDRQLMASASEFCKILLARVAGRRRCDDPTDDLQPIAGMNVEHVALDKHQHVAGSRSPVITDTDAAGVNDQP